MLEAAESVYESIVKSLQGRMEIHELSNLWIKYDSFFVKNKLLGDAVDELTHFLTDSDIRCEDNKYDLYMRSNLEAFYQKLSSLLRQIYLNKIYL